LLPLSSHALRECLMPETVIGGPLLRVLQAIIGDADGLEPRFAVGTAGVAVGVILHRQLAIGGFDRPPIGIAADVEQLIEIYVHGVNGRPRSLSSAGAGGTGGGCAVTGWLSPSSRHQPRRIRRRRHPRHRLLRTVPRRRPRMRKA